MLFPTAEFFVFFTVVFLLYWYVFTKAQVRKILLVVANIVFYAFFSFRFAVLMIALTAINCGFGLALTKIKNFKPRKAVLIAATAFNILYLLYFKEAYSLLSFLNNSFPQLFSEETFLKLLSATAIVPLGVSYYVFKCCSYLFDVYLGKLPVHKSFINLTLYIRFSHKFFRVRLFMRHIFSSICSKPSKRTKTHTIAFHSTVQQA